VSLYDVLADELAEIADEIISSEDVIDPKGDLVLGDAWIDKWARRITVAIAEHMLTDTEIVMVDTRAVGE
jgi:hypothetical protein